MTFLFKKKKSFILHHVSIKLEMHIVFRMLKCL